MQFCSSCGAKVILSEIKDDPFPRFKCVSCDTIHYENPKCVTGCLPVWEDEVLLCKRAIEPGFGQWTLPAGFLEKFETIEQGALREAKEEANIEVELQSLFSIYSVPHVSHVQIIFLAKLKKRRFRAGSETLEVDLFKEKDIPWKTLAFSSVEFVLKNYFNDMHQGKLKVHCGSFKGSI